MPGPHYGRILAVRMPDDIRAAATERARIEGTTLAELVRAWIAAYIATGSPERQPEDE